MKKKFKNSEKWDQRQAESKFMGKSCELCGLEYIKGRRFVEHHITYSPEVTAILCFKCHQFWHGRTVWKHPFVIDYGKDWGPLHFFAAAIKLYKEKTR